MKKVDRRVLRTQHSLGDALVNLTLDIGYDAITIKELTQQANIGYATFFRHFKSKDELLMYVLDSVLSDLSKLTSPDMSPYDQALVMYNYIKQHCRIYQVLVNVPRDSQLAQAVYNVVETNVRQKYFARDEGHIPMDAAVNHVVTSIIELIRWWIMNKLRYTPEQMATIQSELIIKATELVALERVEPLPESQIAAD